MKIKIDNYTISTLDEHNFQVIKTREKKAFRGKKSEGETDVLIGYYGTLGSALNKVANDSVLSSEGTNTLQKLLKALSALQKTIDKVGDVRPKEVK